MGKNLITVKVKPKTFQQLIRAKALMELQEGKRHSMDDLISHMITLLPRAKVNLIIENQTPAHN